jgi:hypothetical protein
VSNRFCPTCHAEVEDTGGFCLLGHSLRVAAPDSSDSLSALRAEVDQAFEDARVAVGHALSEVPSAPASYSAPAPASYSAPAPAAQATPPPPPPSAPAAKLRIEGGYTGEGHDPITDFAPAARMDWGPERQGFLKRRG